MINIHAKLKVITLLALAIGTLAGCGGESGGLPSGLGATLQGVKIRTNVLSLSTSGQALSDDGSRLPEVIQTVAESGSNNDAGTTPTRSFRIRLKGAGPTSKDVIFDARYYDANADADHRDAVDPFASGDLIDNAATSGATNALNARRAYIFDPTADSSGEPGKYPNGEGTPYGLASVALPDSLKTAYKGAPPFLIRLAASDGHRPTSDGDLGTFEYAGFPFASTPVGKQFKAYVSAYLGELNAKSSGAYALQNGYIANVNTTKVVQYSPPTGVPMRRGTFDTSIEFYTESSPGDNAPFFVSYLKESAIVTNKDVTIKPAAVAGDDAYDPTRRFAKPVSLTVKYNFQNAPNYAHFVRVTVKEVGSQLSGTEVSYSTVVRIDKSNPEAPIKFSIINRLRNIAAQIEAYLPQPASADDLPDTVDASGQIQVASLAMPPFAVGNSLATDPNGTAIGPEVTAVPLPNAITLPNRIDGLLLRETVTKTPVVSQELIDSGASYPASYATVANIPSGDGTQVAVLANLKAAPATAGPFSSYAAGQTIALPPAYYLHPDQDYSVAFFSDKNGTVPDPDLGYLVPSIRTEDGYVKYAKTEARMDYMRVDAFGPATAGTTNGHLARSFEVDPGTAISTSQAVVKVSGFALGLGQKLGSDDATLVRSLVVTATDNVGGVVTRTQAVTPTANLSTINVPVINRGLPFYVTVKAYTGPNGSGALLDAQSGNLADVTGSNSISFALRPLVSSGPPPIDAVPTLEYTGLNHPGTAIVRHVQYTPTLLVTGFDGQSYKPYDLSTGYATFTASSSDVTIDSSTGVFTVQAPDDDSTRQVTITARTSDAPAVFIASKTFTIAPDRFTVALQSKLSKPYGYRARFTEDTTSLVSYAGFSVSEATALRKVPVLANNAHGYAVALELTANEDSTGTVLARMLSTVPPTSTNPIDGHGHYDFEDGGGAGVKLTFDPTVMSTVNLVESIDGATVSGTDLQGYTMIRGKSYEITPLLSVSPVTRDALGNVVSPQRLPVSVRLFNVTFGTGNPLTYDANTGKLSVNLSVTAKQDATIVLQYDTGGTPLVKEFHIHLVPASGGVGGTIG